MINMADGMNPPEHRAEQDARWAFIDKHPIRNSLIASGVALGGISGVLTVLNADINIVEKVAAVGASGVVTAAGGAALCLILEGPAFISRK